MEKEIQNRIEGLNFAVNRFLNELIEALKVITEKVDDLQAQVDDLKAQLDDLQGRIYDLKNEK